MTGMAGRTGPPRLLGREGDLQACLAVHHESRPAPGVRSVVVDGEMGIGKSALLTALARRLAPQRVVSMTCTEQTRSVAGALLEELLGAHVGARAEAVHALLDSLTAGGARWSPIPLHALRELDRVLASSGRCDAAPLPAVRPPCRRVPHRFRDGTSARSCRDSSNWG